ncbi:MAG: peptidylprolyl isomerase [Flavobacteriales bacterium]|nr:peptidylprolyl isomerase [Flavobacteriales bacterium]
MKWRCTDLLVACALLLASPAKAQPVGQFIDGVIANVGGNVVLYSDLATRLEQARNAGETVNDDMACRELESLLTEKLLLEQARIDSLYPEEQRVEGELDRRIRIFAQQLGGEEELEKFYGKSIKQIKSDFREAIREQLMIGSMQDQVTGGVRVTPKEVERFFKEIPEDSLPFINAEVEWSMILRKARPSEEEERRVRRKCEELRERAVKGEDFCVLATLYSEDPGSRDKCGELGMVPTGVMVPEFDAVAMSLKDGEISQVFKTSFGYHFMQMIERRGERYNARHILVRAQTGAADLRAARQYVDSVAALVRDGLLDFGRAAAELSDDEESQSTSGVMLEPNTGATKWAIGDLDQQTFFVIDKLKVAQIGEAQAVTLPDGTQAYRVIRLNSRTEPHRMNLKDDYELILQATEGRKRQEVIDKWIGVHIADTYVRVLPDYAGCRFDHPWVPVKAE